MPRKANLINKPSVAGQYSSKVYWSNGEEELTVRIRAKSLGKTISRYIRDLVMLDMAINSKPQPHTPAELPPGFNPDENLVFFKPGELEKQEEGLTNEELKKLLEE